MEEWIRSMGVKASAEINHDRAVKAYYDNPNHCAHCGKLIEIKDNEKPKDTRKRKFCDRSCAAKYNNLHREFNPAGDNRTKDATCFGCGLKIKVNIRSDILKCKCAACKKKRTNPHKRICIICGDEFNGPYYRKTCSVECKHALISINRSNWLIVNGTNNFSTQQGLITYKHVTDVSCDSLLEKAAVIYLVDVFGIDKIKRFRSILNFFDSGFHRTFNPDFFTIKDDSVYIVEVKMRWSSKSTHMYNRTIPLKKIALKAFCDARGYEMI